MLLRHRACDHMEEVSRILGFLPSGGKEFQCVGDLSNRVAVSATQNKPPRLSLQEDEYRIKRNLDHHQTSEEPLPYHTIVRI